MSGSTDTAVWQDSRLTRRGLLLDGVLAAGFGMFAVLAGSGRSGAGVVAAGMLAVALAIRRWWPPGMVALGFAAALVQVVFTDIAYAADVAYFPLFFTLGASSRHVLRRLGLVAASLAIVVAGAYGGLSAGQATEPSSAPGQAPLFAIVGTGALCAVFTLGGWLTGFLRWQSRQTVQARIDAALEARVSAVEQQRLADSVHQEAERGRLAADMHDVIAHSWAVVAAQADGARYGLRAHPEEAETALRTIGETARSAMTDVRRLLTQLRDRETVPVPLDFERRGEMIARMRASGMTIVESTQGSAPQQRLLTVTAHRLLGEALTNALKHGDLSRPVEVVEDWSHGYRLRVRNAVPAERGRQGHDGHGLVGMQERADIAGGTFASRLLASGDAPDVWEVAAFIPLPVEEER